MHGCAIICLLFGLVYGDEILYNLFTRNYPNSASLGFETGEFNKSLPLKILIHGWLGKIYFDVYNELRNLLFYKENCNVLQLNWSNGNAEYGTSVLYTKIVGNQLGDSLIYLFKSFDHIHLIGFGIGSHLASFAARRVTAATGKKIGRLTGMNPSLPLFNGTTERLYKTDATMVDVYHCDGYRFGIGEPIGTVDFYINGGLAPQPGCNDTNLTLLEIFYRPLNQVLCSHAKCRTYFTNSLTKNYKATKCNSYKNFKNGVCKNNATTTFGYFLEKNASGTYYLNTRF